MTKYQSLALAIGAALCAPLASQGTPDPNGDLARHVAARITFGANRALIAQLGAGLPAVQAYIAAQLNPPLPGAPNYHGSTSLDELLTGSIAPGTTGTLKLPTALGGAIGLFETSAAQIAYALESEWQLREVMTQFWERHFNTNLVAKSSYFTPYIPLGSNDKWWAWFVEFAANQFYRANCLTTFANLLTFTSTNASMMIYLDMPQNDGISPNENYAREVLELFSISQQHELPSGVVLANYDQSDIENVARILTGWDLDEANGFVFQFDDPDHSYPIGNTVLFASSALPVTINQQVSPNGVQEGYDLLAALAGHPATASFVCRKLIAHFIDEGLAEQATSPVLQAMLGAWGANGDIKAVLGAMFASNEFLGTGYRLTKVRLPLDSVVGTARAIEATIKKSPALGNLADPNCLLEMIVATVAQGQWLLQYPTPNGFPTHNNALLSPSVGLERAYWGWNVLLFADPNQIPATNPVAFIQPAQPPLPANPTAGNVGPHLLGVIDYLLTSFYGSNYTLADEARVADAMVGAITWVTAQTGAWDPAQASHYATVIDAATAAALGMVQSGQR